jgi:helicase
VIAGDPMQAHSWPVCSDGAGMSVRPITEATSFAVGQRPGLLPRQTRLGQRPVDAVHPPVERRRLYWCKTTNPSLSLPDLPSDVDIRVILPDGPVFAALRDRLTVRGIPWRAVSYWYEDELVSSVGPEGALVSLAVTASLTRLGGMASSPGPLVTGQVAFDARDAFEISWDAHEPDDTEDRFLPAGDLVPSPWLDYLPHEHLNPAQAEAAPVIVGSGDHVVVAAPTGAGKSVVGMLAVLRAILDDGRKAAWLVPQRSLTDELDRELESWRQRGMRVERLSGEYTVDVDRLQEADLIVATTEKFEAMCRASSLQAVLAEVGCVVVDEIHLLGSPQRGPLLEAMLARIRGQESTVRIVGLSATVSNAADIADWLGGQLVRTTWRPSRLTWQLPMIPAVSDPRTNGELRDRVTVDLVREVTQNGGSVLVFCGTKRNIRRCA